MSLWDKWEKEKLKRQGIIVERTSDDVEIHDTHPKVDLRKHAWITALALLICLAVVYFAIFLNSIFGSYWSDTFIVRYFVERAKLRAEQSLERENQ